MSGILLVDGVKYKLWIPEKEAEFEEIVKEHSKEIFGNDTLYVDVKKRIKSESGNSSTPDGYLVDFSDNSLWIVEVELSKHSHKHMVMQLDAFLKSINPETQKEIVEAIYSVINGDVLLEAFVRKRLGSKDIHHFLSELISKDLDIIVAVEELNEKVEKAFENFKVQPYFVELKTFKRVGIGIGAHAHLITVPNEEWELELLPTHAVYDEEKKVFRCNCGGETHKSSSTYKAGEIAEHLWLAHGIPYDEQKMEEWTDDLENQFIKYFAKKRLKAQR
jgi:hypothetical protein